MQVENKIDLLERVKTNKDFIQASKDLTVLEEEKKKIEKTINFLEQRRDNLNEDINYARQELDEEKIKTSLYKDVITITIGFLEDGYSI